VINTAVALVVSSGLPHVAVPDVVNLTQAAASSALTAASLTVGAITTASSLTVPAGSVISQNPAAGSDVVINTAVALVVSSGLPHVAVPDVVNLAQAAASSTLTAASLTVGTITTASSLTVPAGNVISQNPSAGADVVINSAVALVVSSGLPYVAVPSVTGLTQAAAASMITTSGLTVGSVTTASSPTVPAGSVISQTPAAGSSVAPGSSVTLVVSSGSSLVTVPNVVNLTQASATSAITGAGLVVGSVTNLSSTIVPAGSVISQSLLAGTLAPAGSVVALTVSSGTPGLSIANASVTEGNTGCSPCTSLIFTVTLSAPSSQTVTVAYSTLAGTASASADFNAASGTLTFAPGEVTKTIAIQVVGDTRRENTETLTARLSGAVNATITRVDGMGMIVDDDS
jgi:beta-lactam-binding protein with PASTA domain